MKIGIPKEVKVHEYRVGMTPAGVRALVASGHDVYVEQDAGARIGFGNEAYIHAGAKIASNAQQIYDQPIVVKVKEPQPSELDLLHEGQVLFTYLHLAPDPEQTRRLLEKKVIGIAYETVTNRSGQLPLLAPMSEVAGRIAVQAAATGLQLENGGNGMLLGGVAGTAPAKVIILGAGVVGTESAKMALGARADVTILDTNIDRLRYLDDTMGHSLKTRFSDTAAIEELVSDADVVIGSVLIPGKKAPRLIPEALVKKMKPGAVLVDVAIDQGGCAETSRPTNHAKPYYIEHGVVHYCVTNMPGATARTSTLALTNATLAYVMELTNKGYKQALLENSGLRNGLNVYRGGVTNQAVAEDLGYEFIATSRALN